MIHSHYPELSLVRFIEPFVHLECILSKPSSLQKKALGTIQKLDITYASEFLF